MSEGLKSAAGTLVPDEKFGRNQIIGLGALFTPWLVVTIKWLVGGIEYADWIQFHSTYLWPGLITVLGLGAASSIAKTIKGHQ